ARGVGKGTRVGFIAGNGPKFALWLAATARIGAVAIPISTMIRANELVRVLRQSDIAGLIVQRHLLGYDYVERIREALPALDESGPALRLAQAPFLRWIAVDEGELPGSMASLSDVIGDAASVSEDLLVQVESEVATTDQMFEIYTSGSMALPKGVRHNHGPVLFRTHYMRGMVGFERGKAINAMLPMFWIGGIMMYLMPGLSAGCVVTCGERTLNNSRVAMGSVLTAEDLKMMSNQPKPWWGLGMSETLGPYSYGDEFRAEGYPVCAPMDNFADGYEVRIVDEGNVPVAHGEIGELQIRGYPVTPGLHKIERSEFFTADGFFRTGDMCLFEQRGEKTRANFVGRGGDMIKTAGSNVSPAEVEMEMQALPMVEAAYVAGLPDHDRGQLLVAAVIPREGHAFDPAEIEGLLRKQLSGYKVPRAYVAITRDEVPMLHSNKVSRRMVADMLAQKLRRA
ncbi:MAG: acyl--CoA ligase, partial [Sphingomonadales bacterium]|nr:acyl--CoA ligase [Sphingomonadales bacterium]